MNLLDRSEYLLQLLSEHMIITTLALTITIIAGISLGILAFYNTRIKVILLPIINFLYTIPSIAMFGLLIPLVGIGFNNAIIVLVLYGLLPMVRNTYTGFTEVDPVLVDVSKGMGASPYQTFRDVLFPLALPSILSAIRVTTVMLAALTGLAALIGAGGLGQAIFRGLNTMNTPLILFGSLSISAFAIVGDRFIGGFEGSLQKLWTHNASVKQKRWAIINTGCFLMALITALIYTNPFESNNDKIVVASKPTSEQFILGELISQVIENNTTLEVIRKFGIGGGTNNMHPAILNGEIDMYVEYTGTGWMTVLKQTLPEDKQVDIETITNTYKKQFDIQWMGLLGFNNTYALAITEKEALLYNINSCSDLARHSHHFTFGAEFDFFERSDGYKGLKDAYNLKFKDTHEMDINLRYIALEQGKVNCIDAFTTDAKIRELGLRILEDDKNYFPSYEAGLIVRQEIINIHPELVPLLQSLNNTLSNKDMIQLNYAVEIENKEIKDVVANYLSSQKHN